MSQPEEPIEEIELRAGDAVARVLSFGAVLRDLIVPAPGGPRRVVLGYEDIALYRTNPPHLGATCGRVANRIGKGRFTLDGTTYQLALNEKGRTHLHGGERGFDRRPWTILARDAASVTLGRTSPDGEEGYPGTVEVRCTYRLKAPGTLRIEMEATDRPDHAGQSRPPLLFHAWSRAPRCVASRSRSRPGATRRPMPT